MRFDVLTIFPEIINHYCSQSILGRAQKAGLIELLAHNFRDYTLDKHGHVDDRSYGGGPGMVLQVQPIFDCLRDIKTLKHESIKALKHENIKSQRDPFGTSKQKMMVIALDPAGKKFDQRMAERFANLDRLVFVCGRYEGFDERVYKLCDERVSVGDYILAGGELPALTIIEAVSRLLPGVLGNEESLREETFSDIKSQKSIKSKVHKVKSLKIENCPATAGFRSRRDKLRINKEHPQYTRPEVFNGWKVPKVLLSGDHEKIVEWRKRKTK